MTKRTMIGIAAGVTLAAAAALFLIPRTAPTLPAAEGLAAAQAAVQEKESPSTAPGVASDEIAIRNVTDQVVQYSLRPYGEEAPAAPRTLKPGAIDRFPATQLVVVSYLKYGREVTYSLYPGKPYSFRFDTAGKIDIWVGAHGREDAVDLAPYVPTPPEVLVKMLDLAEVGPHSVVYDIGCGDGRIVVYAAKTFGARGVGIDIDPERIRESKANAKRSGVEKLVKFKRADAMKVDVSEATVVTLYLLPESNEMLRPKLEKELKAGVFVVTHNYMIPGWGAKEVVSSVVKDAEGTEHSVFLYKR
jgi:hypothetical protein